MHSSMRIMFYEKYLQYKIGDENSKTFVKRIAISLLIKRLKGTWKLINKIKNQNILNPEQLLLLEELEKKLKWLLTKIFLEKEEIISLKNICLIIRFQLFSIPTIYINVIYLLQEFTELYPIQLKKELFKNTKNLKEILKWKGFECENEKEQKLALIEQRAYLTREHTKFIKKEWKNKLSKICEKPGIKTRFQQLIPQLKMFSVVLKTLDGEGKGGGFL
uniref:Uncharacterized protein n=1 Tax=Meloidogyne floridensis TaxID=298350 RepID=A0A915NNG7_9BILA